MTNKPEQPSKTYLPSVDKVHTFGENTYQTVNTRRQLSDKIDVQSISAIPRTQLTLQDVQLDHKFTYVTRKMNFTKDLNLKGKYCYHPFNTITIDQKGEVYVCICQAWLPISVGNIFDFTSLDDIVHSPKAREIQASILDGSYKYCDHNSCGLIQNQELENRIDHRPDTVNWINFAIDSSCNLQCPSCRKELLFENKGPEFDFRMKMSEHIARLIGEHHHWIKFSLSGDGDPFASHVYRNLLENLDLRNRNDVEIEINTNGMLVEKHWPKMGGVHKNVIRFKISYDAASESVYNITRKGGDWDNLLECSEYIIKWKQKNYSDMAVAANFVVQKENYRDMIDYVIMCSMMGFDEIYFQKITDWGTFGDNFNEQAVWQPEHPEYNELIKILQDPVFESRKVNFTNLADLYKIALSLK